MTEKTFPIFVVQKHEGQRFHYDFRLQIGNHLVSWVVPKGLSETPNEKRLALRTKNRSLSYADFQGIIPEGEYGAGKVKKWDKGTYEPVLDEGETMKDALKDGGLKFNLHGKKYTGLYAMGLMDEEDGQENWVIFKLKDKITASS